MSNPVNLSYTSPAPHLGGSALGVHPKTTRPTPPTPRRPTEGENGDAANADATSVYPEDEARMYYSSIKGKYLDFFGKVSRVTLCVVERQNENLILGMDWMEDEDVLLDPKNKLILLRSHVINSAVERKEEFQGQAELVNQLLQEFPKITEVSEQQPVSNAPYEHRIITGDAAPVVSRDYHRSPAENAVIKQEVESMLAKGVIRPSSSPWCSPVVLITKPDKSTRFCIDYRALNLVTKKDKYPIPRITELLDELNGYKYFTTIDLKAGYWHIPVAEQDICKTAFTACSSLCEFLVLPFGVTNGSPNFQRFMHGVLQGIARAKIYLDNIICFAASIEQHLQDLKLILSRLNQYNLKIAPAKCQWFCLEVTFLGFFVSGSGLVVD